MLELRNRTALAAAIAILPDAEGIDTLVVAIKAAHTFAGEPLAAPIEETDRIAGDTAPVLAMPGDIGLPKPATDVLVAGCVYAPGGSARSCSAGFAVGTVRKRLQVSGDRRWRRRLFSWRPGDPEPFARIPLDWSRAVGGVLAGGGVDERNPVGVGLAPTGDAPLPNLEFTNQLLRSPDQRPPPAGCGAVAAHWQPRLARAGTFDERWERERAPYLPDDFDQRFLCCAPSDQVANGHLAGDEEVELDQLTPGGRERFALRSPWLAVEVRCGATRHDCLPRLDTVAIDAEARSVSLLWRASWRCDRLPIEIDAIEIAEA